MPEPDRDDLMQPIGEILRNAKEHPGESPFPDDMKGTTVIVDPAIPAVWQLWDAWTKRSDERDRWRAHLGDAARAVAPPVVQRSGFCDNQSVQRHASQCHRFISVIAEREAVKISRRRWINYVRRLPPQALAIRSASGVPPEESTYHSSIVDALTALHGADVDSIEETKYLEPRASEGSTLGRIVECVHALAEYQNVFRWAGRGARYHWSPGDVIARRAYDRDFETAVDDYDRRKEPHSGVLSLLLGTVGGERPHDTDGSRTFSPTSLFGVGRVRSPGWHLVRDMTYQPKVGRRLTLYTRFSFVHFSFEFLVDLFNRAPTIPQALEPSIAITLAFLAATGGLTFNNEQSYASVLGLGLIDGPSGVMYDGIRLGFPRALEVLDALKLRPSALQTPDDLIQKSARVSPRLWPVRRGAFVRQASGRTTFDIFGATTALLIMLRQASCGTGELGRLRGAHFEDSVQQLIDRTTWKPTEELSRLRRRKLTIDGVDVSDIDAIAAKGDRLFLVSCKGRVHDDKIEIGEYSASRNVQTLARESVTHWRSVVAKLRLRPQGDNFDFRAFRKISGVVCFPFPVFVPDRALIHRLSAPGLPTLLTAEELYQWLRA